MVSHPTIPTVGGTVTRHETYAKILHHLGEIQSLCAVMAHLHNTEDNSVDHLLAKGWLGMSELFRKIQFQITALAQRRLQ